jgi:hypothetical protein
MLVMISISTHTHREKDRERQRERNIYICVCVCVCVFTRRKCSSDMSTICNSLKSSFSVLMMMNFVVDTFPILTVAGLNLLAIIRGGA